MKKTVLLLITFSAVLLSSPNFAHAQASGRAANILVDDDKVQCPTAEFTTIQAAVNAATPGDVIRVCPGTYAEQLSITKSVSIEGDNGAIVQPDGVSQNAISAATGDGLAAIILVQNTVGVSIKGLIVDGSDNKISACAPNLVGILFQNASGTIEHNAIQHMKLVSSLSGCQSGTAILAQTGSGETGNVTIKSNSVDDYQKNGITGNESGTNVTIDSNAVTGTGPESGAAQNGIQVGFGAGGTIKNNSVADNDYSPCVSTAVCSATGTGILIFQSNDVKVEGNSVATNQIGIFIGANKADVESNTVFNSLVFDGIALLGNHNTAAGNSVFHSDSDGILIQGNNNSVTGNEITGAQVGIFKVSASSGTTEAGNQISATLVRKEDPTPPTMPNPAPLR